MTHPAMRAYHRRRPEAERAERAFEDLCGRAMPRVPGMCTVIRLAARLDAGRTEAEAAAREYLYRWRLALDAEPRNAEAIWGVPHTLGL